jgi:hypothetical protein
LYIDEDITKVPESPKYEKGYTMRELIIKDKMKRVAKKELEGEMKVKIKNDMRTLMRFILFRLLSQIYITLACMSVLKFVF